MAESSRGASKRKKPSTAAAAATTASAPRRSTSRRRLPATVAANASPQAMAPNPSFSSSRISSYFSNLTQQERYFASFQSREIIDPKYLDTGFFESEEFDCYQVFKNYDLLDFMSIKKRHFPDLVRLFYCNLDIRDECIYSEVKKVPIVIDQGLFYHITSLSSDGEPFEGRIVDDWKLDYSPLDARQMICVEGAAMSGRLLAGSIKFDCRVMHYIISRILHPRLTNLAQPTEEDIILMWALLTGRRIDWAHLVRFRMRKALKANAPLPYAHLITLFLEHFGVPLSDEHFVTVQRSYAIGAGAISSFGYKKNHLGQWVHKRNFQPEEQVERTPSPSHPLASTPSSSSISDLLSELRDLRVYVGERFDSLDSRMNRLEGDMGSIRRHLGLPSDSVGVAPHDSATDDAP